MSSDVDDAMADVLAETGMADEPTRAEMKPITAVSGEVICTEEEARRLVARVQKSVTSLDEAIREVIQKQAWIPLGYTDAREFWVREFSQSGGKGYSRQHLARTAKLVGILATLVERLGDAALDVSMTERSVRGADENALLTRLEDRFQHELQPGYGTEEVQRIVDDELATIRKEEPGSNQPQMEDLQARFASLGVPPPPLRKDTVPPPTATNADADEAETERPEAAPGTAAAFTEPRVTATTAGGRTDTEDDFAADGLSDDRKGFSGSSQTGGTNSGGGGTGVELDTASSFAPALSQKQMVLAAERTGLVRGMSMLAGITSPAEVYELLPRAEKTVLEENVEAVRAVLDDLQAAIDDDEDLESLMEG